MPSVPAARRRPFNTRPRHGSGSRNKASEAEEMERPPKRRRYIPGGPGGGGRWQEPDGSEELVGGTGPGGYQYTGPKGRVGRENVANGVVAPQRPMRSVATPTERTPRPRREYSRRDRTSTRPRYSSAAAAAAAAVQGDGFKPREERGWEEFHQDLEIDSQMPLFTADEVDGTLPSPMANGDNGQDQFAEDGVNGAAGSNLSTPARRRGRPMRKGDPLLKGIGSPNTPKMIPLPGPNPRERLTLPKPAYKRVDPFARFETGAAHMNYVDRSMASVGYQESDMFLRADKKLLRLEEGTIEEELDLGPIAKTEVDTNAAIGSSGVGRVEYDMDEQDVKWLEDYNLQRKAEQVEPIKPAIFEITMTKIEKEWHALEKRIPKPNPKPPQTHRPRSSSAAAVNGEPVPQGEEQDSKCAICDDGDCENTNAIVFCDGCDLAVHQECYGVPYIPEGQWMCRRCQQIGRGTPTCIFCPNTDGAFKQTVSSRWAHLLCAVWIPEVSLGNSTFMEPVMDVEKVPKQRWRLTCYICRQKMGACIQCGNKNCFEAFHVTCARRARLFLQMKQTHGGVTQMMDASVLKAFCHRHVPNEWRKEHDTDSAIEWAMDYYRFSMRGRQWADSQQAALNMSSLQASDTVVPSIEGPQKLRLFSSNAKKRNKEITKNNGKLPSGAPVIPHVVYESVEGSLSRFTVRKRKEFAIDMCKYWTLKREARRGAALIKRLQLQMESFSSMDVTRRDFAAMGAAGRPRLQRRIDFAEDRIGDVAKLGELCSLIKQREESKLEDVENLRKIMEDIYFPVPPLLTPIIDKAQQLDKDGTFRHGLARVRERLDERLYTSVSTFSADLSIVFSTGIGMSSLSDTAEINAQLSDDRGRKDLSADQKGKRALAKRIIKAIQPALEDAALKESQLAGTKWEEKLQDLAALFETSISSRRDSVNSDVETGFEKKPAVNGDGDDQDRMDVDGAATGEATVSNEIGDQKGSGMVNEGAITDSKVSGSTHPPTPDDSVPDAFDDTRAAPTSMPADGVTDAKDEPPTNTRTPPTPPLSATADLQPPLPHGGIPWYMEAFDPVGTTVHEERWTGRRAMSEELSDMDEGEFAGMEDGDVDMIDSGAATPAGSMGGSKQAVTNAAATAAARKKARARRNRRW